MPTEPPSEPRRVLVVDDDRDFAEGLRGVLETTECQVEIAYDIDAALARLESFSPLAILLDIRLGRTSGIEAIPAFRKADPGAAIVMMTAYADTESAIQALREGAYAYLRKPFDIPDLLATLERIFERVRLERDRMRALEAMRESELLLRRVLEYGSDVVLWLENGGAIRYASPSVGRVLGYDAYEIIGKRVQMFCHPDDARRIDEFLGATDTDGTPSPPFELRLQCKDGQWRTLESLGRSVVDAAVGRTVILNARDITERKNAEAELHERDLQLRHAQKMEAMGRLSGGIAHDFNNLLQAIQGFTDLTLSSFALPAEAQSNLREVVEATNKASKLVRQLLMFSRREEGEFRALDLPKLIEDLGNLLRRLIGANIELSVHAAADTPGIWGDDGAIEQVLVNLCVNARDAMPEGGKISIRLGKGRIDEADRVAHPWVTAGEAAYISVQDTGHGIPFEIQERIFEPFFTTKDASAGTGLGLATVYAIVQQHGGMLRVESAPGRGTEFRCWFPKTGKVPPEPESLPEPAPSEAAHGVVLLVEDDTLVQQLAVRILAGAGYEVLVASDGEAAMRIYEEERSRIEAVVLDIVMPKMGGKEVCETLRRSDPHLPVLFTTGYSHETIDGDTENHHGISVLRKPYRPNELLAAVQRLLTHARNPARSALE